MNDDKKKVGVLGALFVVMLAIGAFQFMGGGGGSSVSPEETKKKAKPANEKPVVTNPSYAYALVPRDPFEPPATPEPVPSTPTATANEGAKPLAIEPLPGSIAAAPSSGVSKSSTGPQTSVTPPAYKVVGVLIGPQPAAFFEDPSGHQQLIRQGAAIDGEARLISVSPQWVVIKTRSEQLRLSVGANAHAN